MPTFPFKLFVRWCASTLLLGALTWILFHLFIDPKILARQLLEKEMEGLQRRIQNDLKDFPDLEKPEAGFKKEVFYLNRLKKKAMEFQSKLLGEKEATDLLARDASSIERIYKAEQGNAARQLLKVRGTALYEDILQRLNKIENSSPFLVIRSIDIERTGEEGNGPLQWELEVEETHSKSIRPDTPLMSGSVANQEAVPEFGGIRNPFAA